MQENDFAADRRAASTPGGRSTEKMAERTFLAIYGSPALQAAFGIDPATRSATCARPATSPLHRQLVETRIAELRSQIDKGGLREAVVRAALYVGMARQLRRRARLRDSSARCGWPRPTIQS